MTSMRYPNFPRANVLVLGSNSVQSLLPSTLISQADALLENHRLEDVVNLADQQRRKLQAMMSVDLHEADELRYVYQRIGFQHLTETLFDDAGRHLFDGDLDPRVLISYYPELCGTLFSETDSVDVFAGVAEFMPTEMSIDEISKSPLPVVKFNMYILFARCVIVLVRFLLSLSTCDVPSSPPNNSLPIDLSPFRPARLHTLVGTDPVIANLVRNYSPHLSPNTREAPPTVELRKILGLAAREMLEVYLQKWRKKLSLQHPATSQSLQPMRMILDTVLAKLHAQANRSADLLALIIGPNNIVLSEIEPVLMQSGRYSALCELYRQCGEDTKLLETWSKLVDGEWTDEDVQDPLSRMFDLLNERRDRALIQRWGIWLTKKDSERALKLLMSLGSSKRKTEDDRILLQQIKDTNPAASIQFLEYLVLQRRSLDPELHMQLAMTYVDQLLSCLADESTSKLWRAKASSYASSRSETTFLSYFASTTPDSESKRVRLKTALFLQGSTSYDAEVIRSRLISHEKILKLELAIVDGKLGRHRSALSTLVHDLNDSTSAEAYFYGERYNLQQWTSLLVPVTPAGKRKVSPSPIQRVKTVNEDLKKELIKILLEVYMSGGEATAERTAHLLNAQAMNLDDLDVVSLIPPEWPLRILSTFLTRSFRRTLHAQHQGQIVKAISAGENLAVAEKTWLILREQGAVIEEAADEEDNEGSEKLGLQLEEAKGFPASFNEKIGIHDQGELGGEDEGLEPAAGGHVVDISVSPAKKGFSASDLGTDVDVGT
ncbi:Transforming growth factor-beta receptor-associated protein 1 [Grifola frondosa]|uniref:Transforming growth factor-beta receptor-associated protein 1 n=1 Tax=Grifola frondosa TaxID=5627 RepID=A0A1C7LT02_GRIFR|nr:Transforming growth factor-beta receptor-associated protein 1 [Grifola frondosa]